MYATFASQITASQVTLPHEQVEAIRQAFAEDVLSQLQNLYYDTALSSAIATHLLPSEDILTRLQTIPGIGRRLAEIIIAE